MDRIDLHGRNQLQRNGVADRVLHGRATGTVRQGVRGGKTDGDVSRGCIGRNLHFDLIVLPSARPDDQVAHHNVVDAEHRIGIARAGRNAEMLAHNLNRMAGLDRRRVNREDFRINDGKRSRLNLLFSDQHFDRAALRLRGDFHLDYILIPPLDEGRNSSEEHTIDLRGFELSEPLADNRHRGPRDSGLWLQFDLRRRGAGRPAARPTSIRLVAKAMIQVFIGKQV